MIIAENIEDFQDNRTLDYTFLPVIKKLIDVCIINNGFRTALMDAAQEYLSWLSVNIHCQYQELFPFQFHFRMQPQR